MNVKVMWGQTVHADDSIAKTTITTFDDEESFKIAWANRERVGTWTGNVVEFSMSQRVYVPIEEYFCRGEEE